MTYPYDFDDGFPVLDPCQDAVDTDAPAPTGIGALKLFSVRCATRFAGREWLYSPAAKKILKRSWHIEAEPSAKPLRHKGTDLIRLETPLPAITVYAVKGAPTGETSWDNIDLTLRDISEATVEKQEEALRKKRSLSSRCPSYKNGAPAGRQIKQTKDTGFETPTKPHGILGRLKGLFDKFRK